VGGSLPAPAQYVRTHAETNQIRTRHSKRKKDAKPNELRQNVHSEEAYTATARGATPRRRRARSGAHRRCRRPASWAARAPRRGRSGTASQPGSRRGRGGVGGGAEAEEEGRKGRRHSGGRRRQRGRRGLAGSASRCRFEASVSDFPPFFLPLRAAWQISVNIKGIHSIWWVTRTAPIMRHVLSLLPRSHG
jgi:hypothetical protein